MSISLPHDTYYVGVGLYRDGKDDPRPVAGDPAKEYASVNGAPNELVPFSFDKHLSPHCKPQPAHVLRHVARIPAIQSSLVALKSMILSSGFEFTPAVAGENESKERVEEAKRAVQECERAARRLDQSLEVVAWEMLDAMVERHKLAEIVMQATDGGAYTLKAIRPKPHWCYRFRVDGPMNVVAIDVWDGQEWTSLEPGKFTWLTWQGRNGDPRGSESILDGSMPYVGMLLQLWPEALEYWKQFGSPRTIVILGEGAAKTVTVKDADGNPTSKTISGELHAAQNVQKTKGGGTSGLPPKSDAKLLESTRDGQSLTRALEIIEAQAIKSILLVVQATVEAQHASRADSQTKKGITENFAGYVGSNPLCSAMRKPFFELLKANHGEQYARDFTPYLGLGRVNAEALAKVAQAVGVLYQSGFFTEAQLVWLDAFIGLPPRSAGEARVGPQKDTAGPTPAASGDDEQGTQKPAPSGGAAT